MTDLPNPADIPELICERFPVNPPEVHGEKNPFQRIILFEFCGCGDTANMEIKKLDLHLPSLFPKLPKERREELAEDIFCLIKATPPFLCQYDTSRGPVALSSLWNTLLDFAQASATFEVKDFEKHKATYEEKLGIMFKTDDTPATIFDEIFVYPAHFDIDFYGPTAVIVRSEINHLHFRPDALHFRNVDDTRYYREIDVSFNMKTVSFINSYWDGGDAVPAERNTPYNQQHKIDFEMIWSNFAYSESTEQLEWLMTPIRVDPPMNNTGGGGPGGGG